MHFNKIEIINSKILLNYRYVNGKCLMKKFVCLLVNNLLKHKQKHLFH